MVNNKALAFSYILMAMSTDGGIVCSMDVFLKMVGLDRTIEIYLIPKNQIFKVSEAL